MRACVLIFSKYNVSPINSTSKVLFYAYLNFEIFFLKNEEHYDFVTTLMWETLLKWAQ